MLGRALASLSALLLLSACTWFNGHEVSTTPTPNASPSNQSPTPSTSPALLPQQSLYGSASLEATPPADMPPPESTSTPSQQPSQSPGQPTSETPTSSSSPSPQASLPEPDPTPTQPTQPTPTVSPTPITPSPTPTGTNATASPSPAARPPEDLAEDAMWQGTITVTLENLPGLQDQTCWAVYTEVGITSALSCDGCDQIFEITRTLIDSDSICGWTQQELDIYALWASENRVDHHVGEEGLVLSPWLQIDSTELRWDEKEAAWFIHYTYRGHPTAGFNSTSARAQAFRLSLL